MISWTGSNVAYVKIFAKSQDINIVDVSKFIVKNAWISIMMYFIIDVQDVKKKLKN